MESIEGSYMSIARWAAANWSDLTWFPLWFNGMPFEKVYQPGFHFTVAGLSTLLGWTPQHAYHFLTAITYSAGALTLFWLCYAATKDRVQAFAGGVTLLADLAGLLPGPADPGGCRWMAGAPAIPDTRALRRGSPHQRGRDDPHGDSGAARRSIAQESHMHRARAFRAGSRGAYELARVDGTDDGRAGLLSLANRGIPPAAVAGADRDGSRRVSDRIAVAAAFGNCRRHTERATIRRDIVWLRSALARAHCGGCVRRASDGLQVDGGESLVSFLRFFHLDHGRRLDRPRVVWMAIAAASPTGSRSSSKWPSPPHSPTC